MPVHSNNLNYSSFHCTLSFFSSVQPLVTAAIHSDKDEIHGFGCRDQLAEITRDEIANLFGLALSELEK